MFIMKRVRIMLTALAVVAVVGGALAFKAKTFGSNIYCAANLGQEAKCDVLKSGYTFVEPQFWQTRTVNTECTNAAGSQAKCPTNTIYDLP
jgi:hypothetical protein